MICDTYTIRFKCLTQLFMDRFWLQGSFFFKCFAKQTYTSSKNDNFLGYDFENFYKRYKHIIPIDTYLD